MALPSPQANSSVHGAKTSFVQSPALAAARISPLQGWDKACQDKISPTALQADRSESMISTTQDG